MLETGQISGYGAVASGGGPERRVRAEGTA